MRHLSWITSVIVLGLLAACDIAATQHATLPDSGVTSANGGAEQVLQRRAYDGGLTRTTVY